MIFISFSSKHLFDGASVVCMFCSRFMDILVKYATEILNLIVKTH